MHARYGVANLAVFQPDLAVLPPDLAVLCDLRSVTLRDRGVSLRRNVLGYTTYRKGADRRVRESTLLLQEAEPVHSIRSLKGNCSQYTHIGVSRSQHIPDLMLSENTFPGGFSDRRPPNTDQ